MFLMYRQPDLEAEKKKQVLQKVFTNACLEVVKQNKDLVKLSSSCYGCEHEYPSQLEHSCLTDDFWQRTSKFISRLPGFLSTHAIQILAHAAEEIRKGDYDTSEISAKNLLDFMSPDAGIPLLLNLASLPDLEQTLMRHFFEEHRKIDDTFEEDSFYLKKNQ